MGVITTTVSLGSPPDTTTQVFLATGLTWMCKIITDPFHDIMLYHKAPLALLRGELRDPMVHVNHH